MKIRLRRKPYERFTENEAPENQAGCCLSHGFMEKFRYFFKWNHILLIVQISMHHARQEQQLLVAGVRIALDHFGEGIPAEAAGVRLPEKNKTPAGRQAAG